MERFQTKNPNPYYTRIGQNSNVKEKKKKKKKKKKKRETRSFVAADEIIAAQGLFFLTFALNLQYLNYPYVCLNTSSHLNKKIENTRTVLSKSNESAGQRNCLISKADSINQEPFIISSPFEVVSKNQETVFFLISSLRKKGFVGFVVKIKSFREKEERSNGRRRLQAVGVLDRTSVCSDCIGFIPCGCCYLGHWDGVELFVPMLHLLCRTC